MAIIRDHLTDEPGERVRWLTDALADARSTREARLALRVAFASYQVTSRSWRSSAGASLLMPRWSSWWRGGGQLSVGCPHNRRLNHTAVSPRIASYRQAVRCATHVDMRSLRHESVAVYLSGQAEVVADWVAHPIQVVIDGLRLSEVCGLIESVDLVVAALAGGTAAGARETASVAVKDAYSVLKALALRLLRRAGSAPAAVMEMVETDAVKLVDDEGGTAQRRELVAALSAADAGADEELLAAALRVLELIDPAGSQSGKYRVALHDNKGVQVGDHNIQTNTFN